MNKLENEAKKFDVLVIGCGIVGAAAAFELSKYDIKVGVLEKENDVALGATKANSAIIHGGYDPVPGSLMAKLNVRGSELCEDICRALDVPYKRNGAMVVGFTDEDVQTLKGLMSRGISNGVKGVMILDGDEARRREPGLTPEVKAALLVPTSAIVSPWEYCLALAETAMVNGAEMFLRHGVEAIERDGDLWRVTAGGEEFLAPFIVNAAGTYALKIHDMVAERKNTEKSKRGEYFLLDKAEGTRVGHTIFQCPNENGKGVLVTPTVHGNLLVGPNAQPVEWDDTANTTEGLNFVRGAATRSVKDIDFRKSIRNFAGVRATTDAADFIIEEAAPGFVDCCGICSPGLSAAPAIAEYVTDLLFKAGMQAEAKEDFRMERRRIRFKELSDEEKEQLVKEDPAYGRVICRCETITEGEIRDCFEAPIPPVSLDGVKRRAGTGMGRCQGGFCGPRISELFVEDFGKTVGEVLQDRDGSEMFTGRTKEVR